MILAALAGLAAPLSDLRVGTDGDVTRIVVVCETACAALEAGDGWMIEGLDADLSVPLTPETRLDRISFTPVPSGSLLLVDAGVRPASVTTSPCQANAVCLDLDFGAPEPGPAPAAEPETLRGALEQVAGTELTQSRCEAAAASVEADAWALSEFRLHAFCRAADGATEEADGWLARLAKYADDPEARRAREVIALWEDGEDTRDRRAALR